MDKNSLKEQLSRIIIDSSVQNVDFDVTPSWMSSTVTEGYSPTSALTQTSAAVPSTYSDMEHRYQLVGNISVINQFLQGS